MYAWHLTQSGWQQQSLMVFLLHFPTYTHTHTQTQMSTPPNQTKIFECPLQRLLHPERILTSPPVDALAASCS